MHCLIADGSTVILQKDRSYTFDHVFDAETSQRTVYNELIRPMLSSFLGGYNCTVFTYGMTSSGKTYTIGAVDSSCAEYVAAHQGPDDAAPQDDDRYQTTGIVPRMICDLYRQLESDCYKMTVSYLEVYNETLRDLLAPLTDPSTLLIRERDGHVTVPSLTEREAPTAADAIKCYVNGGLVRATASTDMNERSSRSHAIFTIAYEKTTGKGAKIVAKFNLCDLAGSERIKKSNVSGVHLKELVGINSGLLALGNVINALCSNISRDRLSVDAPPPSLQSLASSPDIVSVGQAGDKRPSLSRLPPLPPNTPASPQRQSAQGKTARRHIPFRDSKLTRLLQNSLGGTAITTMIACVSPSVIHVDETNSTILYAARARNIVNRPVVSQEIFSVQSAHSEIKALITSLQNSNSDLKVQLAGALQSKDSLEQEVERLMLANISLSDEIIQKNRELLFLNMSNDPAAGEPGLLGARPQEDGPRASAGAPAGTSGGQPRGEEATPRDSAIELCRSSFAQVYNAVFTNNDHRLADGHDDGGGGGEAAEANDDSSDHLFRDVLAYCQTVEQNADQAGFRPSLKMIIANLYRHLAAFIVAKYRLNDRTYHGRLEELFFIENITSPRNQPGRAGKKLANDADVDALVSSIHLLRRVPEGGAAAAAPERGGDPFDLATRDLESALKEQAGSRPPKKGRAPRAKRVPKRAGQKRARGLLHSSSTSTLQEDEGCAQESSLLEGGAARGPGADTPAEQCSVLGDAAPAAAAAAGPNPLVVMSRLLEKIRARTVRPEDLQESALQTMLAIQAQQNLVGELEGKMAFIERQLSQAQDRSAEERVTMQARYEQLCAEKEDALRSLAEKEQLQIAFDSAQRHFQSVVDEYRERLDARNAEIERLRLDYASLAGRGAAARDPARPSGRQGGTASADEGASAGVDPGGGGSSARRRLSRYGHRMSASQGDLLEDGAPAAATAAGARAKDDTALGGSRERRAMQARAPGAPGAAEAARAADKSKSKPKSLQQLDDQLDRLVAFYSYNAKNEQELKRQNEALTAERAALLRRVADMEQRLVGLQALGDRASREVGRLQHPARGAHRQKAAVRSPPVLRKLPGVPGAPGAPVAPSALGSNVLSPVATPLKATPATPILKTPRGDELASERRARVLQQREHIGRLSRVAGKQPVLSPRAPSDAGSRPASGRSNLDEVFFSNISLTFKNDDSKGPQANQEESTSEYNVVEAPDSRKVLRRKRPNR